MTLRRLLAMGLSVPLAACATAGTAPKVDLASAREALQAAREAGAAERAPDAFTRAQGHLNEAESLAAGGEGPDAREKGRQAEALGRLATSEAQCAATLAKLSRPEPADQRAAVASSAEVDRLAARLKKAEDDQRRLEDKINVLQRDLEVTETEVIRTKSRLKGTETKAEASSAIAEARILMRRLADEKGKTPSLIRCQELIARAEQLLKEENYGAAAFFALKAQDAVVKAQDTAAQGAEAPPPQKRYVVKAAVANIRKGPATSEPVVGAAPRDAAVDGLAVRGEWVKVTFGTVTGWVHRSLVQ